MPVTGEQVKKAAMKAGVVRVHHSLCQCGYQTAFVVAEDELFFDPGCGCRPEGHAALQPKSWDDAADWVNANPSSAEHFGL